MRVLLLFCLLLGINNKILSQIGLTPILVNRIHSDELPFIRTEFLSWIHAFGGGIELYKTNFPISLIYTKDFYYSLDNYDPNYSDRALDINERWEENFLSLNYRFNKNGVGVGYFKLVREAPLNLQSNAFKRDYNGFFLSYTQSFKEIDIEYKSKVNLNGFAAIFGSYPHSISLIYKLGNHEKTLRNERINNFEKKFDLFFNFGGRVFDASGIEVLQFEKKHGLGFKPALGIEIINKKSNLGVFVEKDIWLTFNAGGSKRVVKDQIINNSIGLRYRMVNKHFRDIRFSFGLNFIKDSEVKRELYLESAQLHKKLIINQVRGVLLGVNLELFKNTDLEIRHTIPYISRKENIFERKRFSIGINYRLDP